MFLRKKQEGYGKRQRFHSALLCLKPHIYENRMTALNMADQILVRNLEDAQATEIPIILRVMISPPLSLN
jgi:hypothetical protein